MRRARPGRPELGEISVALETGQKRVFAVALDWPGWARSGRTEEAAMEALADYARRYAAAVNEPALAESNELVVTEHRRGDATTDFGAPGVVFDADARALDDAEIARQVGLVRAAWAAFDDAARNAGSRQLRSGPRGGGRDIPKMTDHVTDAEAAYLAKLGSRRPRADPSATDPRDALREAALRAFRTLAVGGEPENPSQVRERWLPRYWARRSAWHALDHAWEIQDRLD